MDTKSRQYPLGSDRVELDRLYLQHQLWSDAAHALWLKGRHQARRAGARRRLRPRRGAAFDLVHLVGLPGQVHAVDESVTFVDFLEAEASARGSRSCRPRSATCSNSTCPPAASTPRTRAGCCASVPRPGDVIAGVARAEERRRLLRARLLHYTAMSARRRGASCTRVHRG
ncbi:MAG: hypothetical protein IPJ65_39090 [Archangiaceae bacterium]|nr:hypothetical protein [Archangiaceae bacterium]